MSGFVRVRVSGRKRLKSASKGRKVVGRVIDAGRTWYLGYKAIVACIGHALPKVGRRLASLTVAYR